jgi:hypothetical protein
MARRDHRGLPVTTVSDVALQAYNDGVALMLAAWPDAGERLDAAIAADPDMALAHAARARQYAILAQPAKARAAIATATGLVAANGDEREISHVQILSLALNQQPQAALAQALAHLEAWPADAVILSLPLGPFGLMAFSGMWGHEQARIELCARSQSAYGPDDWWFLTYAGWSLAENGEVARGRAMIEQALALRHDNANGVHALAHALFEAGAAQEAERLVTGWLPGYARHGVLHGHLAWHVALLALEAGDTDRALALFTDHVRPAVSQGMAINIVSDGASLLWRLGAYGHHVPDDLWREVADFGDAAFPTAGHAFIDAHMMMLAAARGDQAGLEKRLSALETLIKADALGAGPVAPAIGRALAAFAQGDYAACVAGLEPMSGQIERIGGSRAQREVFEDTLLVALMRSGQAAKARTLLDQRLHRRPSPRDAAWRRGYEA